MNTQNKPNSLSEKVIKEIKKRRVKMKPRIHFALKTAFVSFSIILMALFVLYISSFVLFNLRAVGAWHLSGFGFAGMRALFGFLPWILILSAVCLIFLMEILVKYFSFAYRRPVLYSLIAIIFLVFLGGFILSKTNLHPKMIAGLEQGRFRVISPFYRSFSKVNHNLVNGLIESIGDDSFILKTFGGEKITIITSDNTHFSLEDIKIGQAVLVLGKRKNSAVQALGIRSIKEIFNFSRPMHMQPRRFNETK